MPPLICLSPILLDQSFPRDLDDVDRIGIALGEIQDLLEKNDVHLIITDTLREFVEVFEWNRPNLNEIYDKLQMIYSLLSQLFLQPHERLVTINVPEDIEYLPHPIPEGTSNEGLVVEWSCQVGQMLTLHERCSRRNEFFIGVACENAFSGGDLGKYHNQGNIRCFPLVGPEQLNILTDAYEPNVHIDIRRQAVSFNNAYKNCHLLASCKIEKPNRGSHYQVRFQSASRSWPLDANIDPIPDGFIRELVIIFENKFSLEEIKYVLIRGELPPPKRLKIGSYSH